MNLDTHDTNTDTNVYKSKLGSLESTVKHFSPNITQGYASDDDLRADLTEAATFHVIKIIEASIRTDLPDTFHMFACRNSFPTIGANVDILSKAESACGKEPLSGNIKKPRYVFIKKVVGI